MKQVKIKGRWHTPPKDVESWLSEITSVKLDNSLSPVGYTFRWQEVEAVRDSPRHKEKKVHVAY